MTEPLLDVRGLQRRFGGVVAVSDVDFTVMPGELRSIIGPNGAGKSTFFNMLCGTLRPSAGSITFEGQDVVGLPGHRFARLGIARGDAVRVSHNGTSVELRARLSRDLPAGVVRIAREHAGSLEQTVSLSLSPEAKGT